MPEPDWLDAPYARVYATLQPDHPAIWEDDQLLAWWLRLLVAAEGAYPGAASLPAALDQATYDALLAERIIEPIGRWGYRFHGLAAERNERLRRGQRGGLQRAASAERDSLGRFAGGSLDRSSSGAGALAGSRAGSAAGAAPLAPANGSSATAPAYPARRDEGEGDVSLRSTSPSPAPAGSSEPLAGYSLERGADPAGNGSDPEPTRAFGDGGMAAAAPLTVRCYDYRGHQLSHAYSDERGRWECPICEAERPRQDEPSFRERVADHGGHPF